jgi:hypothetical protein
MFLGQLSRLISAKQKKRRKLADNPQARWNKDKAHPLKVVPNSN